MDAKRALPVRSRLGVALTALALVVATVLAGAAVAPATAWAADGPVRATVGDTPYADVSQALKAAATGDTVTLAADVDLSNAGVFALPDNVTFDLGGHTVSAVNSTVFFEGNGLTIKNGTFDSKGGSYGLFIGDQVTSEGVVVQDVTVHGGINVFNAVDVVLRDVTVDARVSNPYYAVWADVNAQVTLESGSYVSGGAAVLGLTGPQQGAPESTMTVTGGSFDSSASRALVLGGENRYKPVVKGGTFSDEAQVEPYVADGYEVVENGDGSYIVVAPQASDDAVTADLPGSEFFFTAVTPAQADQIENALNNPDVAKFLAEKGAKPEDHWTVNAVLRDRATHVEDHDTTCTITIAYGGPVNDANYKNYDFKVLHIAQDRQDDGTLAPRYEMIDDAQVEATPKGLVVSDTTLSPFVVSYAEHQDEPAAPTAPVDDHQRETPVKKSDAAAPAVADTAPSEKPAAVQTVDGEKTVTSHGVPVLGDDGAVWPALSVAALVVAVAAFAVFRGAGRWA